VAAAPLRRCVGCGRSEPKHALLRMVARDGQLLADPESKLPGRGAYLHRDPSCYRVAMRRRAFSRALREPVSAPAEPPTSFQTAF
jgi:predicted RNA-binding protein YlxR (DUF448 family)